MLDAYLQNTEDFPEMLHYCNVLYETLPMILNGSHLRSEKDVRKLAAIAVVAAGYGDDMDEELANALLDDMDFDRYGKVKCRRIEQMLPKLMKMVEGEMVAIVSQRTRTDVLDVLRTVIRKVNNYE